MLIGISPYLSPDLLATLYHMGHGDEIVLVDLHFPGDSIGQRVLRADGLRITQLLTGILPLIPLDTYIPAPVYMMAAVDGDILDPNVETSYRAVIDHFAPQTPQIQRIERFAFYERVRTAFAVVMTGETAK
jgi:L-fucose mutarotase